MERSATPSGRADYKEEKIIKYKEYHKSQQIEMKKYQIQYRPQHYSNNYYHQRTHNHYWDENEQQAKGVQNVCGRFYLSRNPMPIFACTRHDLDSSWFDFPLVLAVMQTPNQHQVIP